MRTASEAFHEEGHGKLMTAEDDDVFEMDVDLASLLLGGF